MPAAPDFPPAPDRVAPKRALISVSDKTGLVEAAKVLADHGVELVSTGGTRAAIAAAGLAVKDISELTNFPEMMDGRVKTLHPIVHGGLLGVRDAPEHAKAMADHGIGAIDIVYVNLYPFEATVAKGGSFEDCVENIDIGGPAMVRSAAKNHGYVAICTEIADLEEVLAELKDAGTTSLTLRKKLAARAYARTASYDAAISAWFAGQLGEEAPRRRAYAGELAQTMRYGENPHQAASFYRFANPRIGVATAKQLQGKELSYNNINDTDAAYELIAEFDPAKAPACAIIKHANPCGVATGASLAEAYERALACDPTSAFGGIVALNTRLDAATAAKVLEVFTEVVIAPDADEDAVALFRKKKNVRLLVTGGLPDPHAPGETFRSVSGGFLVQSRDTAHLTAADLKVVTKRSPTDEEVRDMLFAFTIAKHVKSNAIVYARQGQTLGVGAGQMNRKDSARIAALRAADFGLDLKGSACASEAFFPFPDGLLQAADAGCTAVIQPGGSIGDDKVIEAADERGIAMVFTGVRVFRH
ncbi:MAG: bifunctional phosphoribosylaminoimidazolecarboxamide formyltransferase/IMP cyclohydrolase [Pseudomonadota bacterium]|uniref:bifunctional phosphoribosylaminoimidazolecarboxamide formyltransferase/IMP cyclohydrolase n=1 Tax=unclassified Phenylobacterium TaxID=2640670 RepID=UPI0006FB5933|nr:MULTISPECIES: bifunctional phosphoribosylaminoimidazolecarboxamide formyltransferase/IMP cyclohydrolase [unclassified Phenylobacterium]KRB41696.1 phosphoribosylaminoimidazolecarboxamide formyltransferase [Phenylobacterium sp. Root700]MBT9473730.1 bifunctional phosphoribosylaminoimidazolecarboxamide formyltransferase/IMP cyclohydrolase [Phenylobacterium sp.]